MGHRMHAIVAAAGAALLLLGGCQMIRLGRNESSTGGTAGTSSAYAGPSAGAATEAEEPARDPSEPPPFAPLSEGAAHPALAGVLHASWALDSMEIDQRGQLYGFDLSGTTEGRATVLEIHTFGIERAIGSVLPPVLEQCRAPGAAETARDVDRVTDPESLQTAADLLLEVRRQAIAESDRAEGRTYERERWGECAEAATEVVRGMMDRLKLRAAAGELGSGVDALTGWVDILEIGQRQGIGGDEITEVLTEQIGHARHVVQTGRVPRSSRRVRSQPAHPAVVRYLSVLNVDAHDLAELLAVDVSDTRRARNVDLAFMVVDVSVRELAPPLVTWCGATLQAQAIADLPRIHDDRTLDVAGERLAILTHWDQPEEQRRCVEFGAGEAREAIGNASEALRFEEGDYNLEPYYARGALSPWARAIDRLDEKGLLDGDEITEARDRLDEAVTWLKRQRRRRD